jgi:hypothetical protein
MLTWGRRPHLHNNWILIANVKILNFPVNVTVEHLYGPGTGVDL